MSHYNRLDEMTEPPNFLPPSRSIETTRRAPPPLSFASFKLGNRLHLTDGQPS